MRREHPEHHQSLVVADERLEGQAHGDIVGMGEDTADMLAHVAAIPSSVDAVTILNAVHMAVMVQQGFEDVTPEQSRALAELSTHTSTLTQYLAGNVGDEIDSRRLTAHYLQYNRLSVAIDYEQTEATAIASALTDVVERRGGSQLARDTLDTILTNHCHRLDEALNMDHDTRNQLVAAASVDDFKEHQRMTDYLNGMRGQARTLETLLRLRAYVEQAGNFQDASGVLHQETPRIEWVERHLDNVQLAWRSHVMARLKILDISPEQQEELTEGMASFLKEMYRIDYTEAFGPREADDYIRTKLQEYKYASRCEYDKAQMIHVIATYRDNGSLPLFDYKTVPMTAAQEAAFEAVVGEVCEWWSQSKVPLPNTYTELFEAGGVEILQALYDRAAYLQNQYDTMYLGLMPLLRYVRNTANLRASIHRYLREERGTAVGGVIDPYAVDVDNFSQTLSTYQGVLREQLQGIRYSLEGEDARKQRELERAARVARIRELMPQTRTRRFGHGGLTQALTARVSVVGVDEDAPDEVLDALETQITGARDAVAEEIRVHAAGEPVPRGSRWGRRIRRIRVKGGVMHTPHGRVKL